jgi:hypothetical protein
MRFDSLFQKTPMFTANKRTVNPGDMHLKIPVEVWFENVKGRREAVLHLFGKQIPQDS